MGKSAEAMTSMLQKCAGFLLSRLRNATPDQLEQAGALVSEAYFKGGSDALTEVVHSCKHAIARNQDCANCPTLRAVQNHATDLLAQCHGAAAEQVKS